jgi:hypothetical protein
MGGGAERDIRWGTGSGEPEATRGDEVAVAVAGGEGENTEAIRRKRGTVLQETRGVYENVRNAIYT